MNREYVTPLPKIIRHAWVTVILCIVVLFFMALPSSAEEDSLAQFDEDIQTLDLAELLSLKLKTGSFLDLDARNFPADITIITRKQIQLSGAKNLGELLEMYVPSFQYMFNRWNGDIWAIRGVCADQNNKVLFLVNGIKMNLQARNGAVTEMNLGLMDDIERIEILQGPAGMVYGSGAIAGVVNVVTSQYSEPGGSLSAYGGTNKNRGQSTWNNLYGLEGSVASHFENSSLILSAGYRYDEGNGDGKTMLHGYQDWPENIEYSNAWPSKGSYGETPGNIRASVDFSSKRFSFYARYTRQQYSTASLFGKYPWDATQGTYQEPLDINEYLNQGSLDLVIQRSEEVISGDTTIIKTWTDTVTLSTPTEITHYVDSVNAIIINHNNLNCPPIEIQGKTYTWQELGVKYIQANQTRRFNLENIAIEGAFEQPFGQNTLLCKVGFITNQNQSFFENDGYNSQQDQFSMNYFWPDLLWASFGERRFYGSGHFTLKMIPLFQSVIGLEYRLDDIGEDFQGRNMTLGSENMHVVTPVRYHNIAGYTENYFAPLDLISIIAGLRCDKHTRTDVIISPKIASIFKPHSDHTIKCIWQMSSNNGDADSYEFNGAHYNFDGTINQTHLNNPTWNNLTRDTTAVVIVPTLEELRNLKPERSMSVELISIHKLFDTLFTLSPVLSYNVLRDNFIWNGELYRKVNIGDYNALCVDITATLTTKKVSVGLSHSFQRPVNTDKNQLAAYTIPTLKFTFAGIDPATQDSLYSMEAVNNDLKTKTVPLLKEFVTYDGKHFLNIVTNTTKLYAEYTPVDRISFSTNARIFWGFPGRKAVNDTILPGGDAAAQASAGYLGFDGAEGIAKSISVKWNMGMHFTIPHSYSVSLFVLNILGERDNVHAVRWQNMVSNLKQRKLYTPDTRSLYLRVIKEF